MRNNFIILLLIFLVSCSSELESIQDNKVDSAKQLELVNDFVLEEITKTKTPFDWNTAPIDILYAALMATDYPLTIGYENESHDVITDLLQLIKSTEKFEGKEHELIPYKNEQLQFFYANISKFETIEQLCNSDLVRYLELPAYPFGLEKIQNQTAESQSNEINYRASNGLTSSNGGVDYFNQLLDFNESVALVLKRHGADKVYQTYNTYGEGIGVAVLDNGLIPDNQTIIESNGAGERKMLGYFNPLWVLPWTQPDGTQPRNYDLLGLSQSIDLLWTHGWQQNKRVLMAAPNATQYSVRSSSFVLVLFPSQIVGIINSIMAMADDEANNIISMSMGSLFRIHQMEDAIDYYHNKDKLFFSAAGTSISFVKDLIGVVFPASYDKVIAVTGIEDRTENNGQFVLGEYSHYGAELDFCIERNGSSSEATSALAGMAALVWSVQPNLSSEAILNALIESSYFYQTNGAKDAQFGWGTPDVFEAVMSL